MIDIFNNLPQGKTVIFAEVLNGSLIQAARFLSKNSLAVAVLLGSPITAGNFAANISTNLSGLKVRNPMHDKRFCGTAKKIFENSNPRNHSLYEIQEKLKTPLWYGLQAVKYGQAKFLVIGKNHNTPEVTAAIKNILGENSQGNFFSAFHLVYSEEKKYFMAFADCSLNVRPSSKELARIAADTVNSFAGITGLEARAAMLSFSTAGSAKHPLQETVSTAVQIAKEKYPGLLIDGEIQFDSAFVPKVAAQKMPDSQLAGKANVFIFPSQNAGNIGLHLAKHIAGYRTIGPFIQGVNRSVIFLPDSE